MSTPNIPIPQIPENPLTKHSTKPTYLPKKPTKPQSNPYRTRKKDRITMGRRPNLLKRKSKKSTLNKDEKKSDMEISSDPLLMEDNITEVKVYKVAVEKYKKTKKNIGSRIT